MAARYVITLACGHLKQVYEINRGGKTDYYCYICHSAVERDMSVKAKIVSVGTTGS